MPIAHIAATREAVGVAMRNANASIRELVTLLSQSESYVSENRNTLFTMLG